MQKHASQQNAKMYLISSPCSGKTAFFNKTKGIYKGIEVIDFEVYISQLMQQAKINGEKLMSLPLEKRLLLYNDKILSFLKNHPGPICVLGTKGPDNPHKYTDITFALVLPPRKIAIKYWDRRKKMLHKGGRPLHRWTAWENIERFRKDIFSYAEQNQIPMYPSFAAAIDGILKR
jgi:hypothetical protein